MRFVYIGGIASPDREGLPQQEDSAYNAALTRLRRRRRRRFISHTHTHQSKRDMRQAIAGASLSAVLTRTTPRHGDRAVINIKASVHPMRARMSSSRVRGFAATSRRAAQRLTSVGLTMRTTTKTTSSMRRHVRVRAENDGRGPNPNEVDGVQFGGEMVGVGIFLFIAFQFFVLAFVDFPFQR